MPPIHNNHRYQPSHNIGGHIGRTDRSSRDKGLVVFIAEAVEQAKKQHRTTNEPGPPAPLGGKGNEIGKTKGRIGQAMEYLVQMDDIRKMQTVSREMRQIENQPHNTQKGQ